jgi:hypothetical protein
MGVRFIERGNGGQNNGRLDEWCAERHRLEAGHARRGTGFHRRTVGQGVAAFFHYQIF